MDNNTACSDTGHAWSTRTPKGISTRKPTISTETQTASI